MIFNQHIKTRLGEIWIVDATENGFVKSERESRQDFEARVLRAIIYSTLGNVKLSHETNGAPFIESRPKLSLSISHSENWFALYVSDNQSVGVDIEVLSNKLEEIQHHFLSEIERNSLDLSPENLRVYWGAKESIIKCNNGNVKNFQHDIQIESISGNTVATHFEGNLLQLEYVLDSHFMLIYTI